VFRSTTFGQIVKLLDRGMFRRVVKSHGSDKYSKGFRTWDHLMACLFSQLSGSKSLRDLEVSFNANRAMHYHAGSREIKRSTLCDANQTRDSHVFGAIARELLSTENKELQAVLHTLENAKLSVLDSTAIRIMGRGSEWTEETKTRQYQGLKLHVQFSPEEERFEHFNVTASNVNDVTAALDFPLVSGHIYTYDKGYCDYNWWNKIQEADSYFITRVKNNAAYEVLEDRAIPVADQSYVLSDQTITLKNKHPRGGKRNELAGKSLRLVRVKNPEDGREYTLISNLLIERASYIGRYYKQRWSIELLFKWLKQNLKLTRFLGQNENAIRIQIYTAIIAYILLHRFKKLCTHHFDRMIDLMAWIRTALAFNLKLTDPPRKRNDPSHGEAQLCLNFGW
jgi:putative transposase